MKPTTQTLNVKFESLGQSVGLSIEPHEPGYQYIVGKLQNLTSEKYPQNRPVNILTGYGRELDEELFVKAAGAVSLYYPHISSCIRVMMERHAKTPIDTDLTSYARLWVSASIGSEAY